MKKTDVLIIGSGIAGLSSALHLSDHFRVTLLTKEKTPDTNTAMAQGGIAAVVSGEDSFASHVNDTLIAGAGLCRADVVKEMIELAPARIDELKNWGVRLSQHLTREGGHSFRRILHHADQTGKEIHRGLWEKVKLCPSIEVIEEHFAIDLLTNQTLDPRSSENKKVVGALVLNKVKNHLECWLAHTVILATGGAGKIYLYTSNWDGATGDGIAMAHRAGARVANMEFMQFHPTCLFHRDSRNFLISEALRGEGGELINAAGEAFMKKHHPLGSLAPRDIVARSIDAEMKKTGEQCVFLDMTHKSREELLQLFPHIFARCLDFGIDPSKQPIPVVPAAHYLCGGVLASPSGQTDLPALWALGETACTGLHGANRLASNSLLEGLVMSYLCAQKLIADKENLAIPNFSKEDLPLPEAKPSDELSVIFHLWDEVRRLMWNYVGIVRTTKRLLRAKQRLKNILQEIKDYDSDYRYDQNLIELLNLAQVADLTVSSALERKESRGTHYTLDFPETASVPQETIL